FRHFVKSMELAAENDDQAMITSAGRWLNWIKSSAVYFPDELKTTVQLGVTAFLEAQKSRGIDLSDITASPNVPWYAEDLLFEVSKSSAYRIRS
uniref:hypothetical protein n=1 Tax=Spirosoma sp. TaxID=1899569 RepID=UPI003B3B83BF